MPGESVIYQAKLHWIVYAWAAVLGGAGVVSLVAGAPAAAPGAMLLAGVAGLVAYVKYVTYVTSEFAVTDKRVLMKVGWIRRRSVETLLGKVEAIVVEQGIGGRLLDYGTIVVTGTGGTRERFDRIAAPLDFRRQVQAQIAASLEANTVRRPEVPMPEAVAGSVREERDCPYCAERILAKARVCKHCGREVEPLV